jgi:polyhydroxyalkanoate synthesis regulator phasin
LERILQMSMKSLRTGLAAAVGGAVLVAGLLMGASLARAQTSDDSGSSDQTGGDTLERVCDRVVDWGHRWLVTAEDVASELGMSLDELKDQLAAGATLEDIATEAGMDPDELVSVLREKATEAVDDAVAEGDLTEEQGEALKERIESFDLGDGMFLGNRGFGFRGHHGIPLLGDLGDALDGVDLGSLREQLQSGATLDEALENLGVDLEELATQIRDNAIARLDDMVEQGRISQEQADAIKERLESIDLSQGVPFGLRGPGFGFRDFGLDGLRGPHGDHRGFSHDQDSTDDSAVQGALLNV